MTARVPELVLPLGSRENVRSKAVRLLVCGRVRIVDKAGDLVHADVLGDNGRYQVGHTNAEGWWCTCVSQRRCSHIVSVSMVVQLP